MKRIDIEINEAQKLGGVGVLKYELWVDGRGHLFVKILDNSEGGTFSALRFPVNKYAPMRNNAASLGQLIGLDADGNERESKDNNADAFLRAVLRHLLDGGSSV